MDVVQEKNNTTDKISCISSTKLTALCVRESKKERESESERERERARESERERKRDKKSVLSSLWSV